MNEVGRPALAEMIPDVGGSLAQVSSNASRLKSASQLEVQSSKDGRLVGN
jgi:hypothetical protein